MEVASHDTRMVSPRGRLGNGDTRGVSRRRAGGGIVARDIGGSLKASLPADFPVRGGGAARSSRSRQGTANKARAVVQPGGGPALRGSQ